MVPEDLQREAVLGHWALGGAVVGTSQSGYKELSKHLPAPLSGSPGISGGLLSTHLGPCCNAAACHCTQPLCCKPVSCGHKEEELSEPLCSRDLLPGLLSQWGLTQASPGMGNCFSQFRCSSCHGQSSSLTPHCGQMGLLSSLQARQSRGSPPEPRQTPEDAC